MGAQGSDCMSSTSGSTSVSLIADFMKASDGIDESISSILIMSVNTALKAALPDNSSLHMLHVLRVICSHPFSLRLMS